MVRKGCDVVSESVHLGRESVVVGVGFTVEEGDMLVVVMGIIPNVKDPTIVRTSRFSCEDVRLWFRG